MSDPPHPARLESLFARAAGAGYPRNTSEIHDLAELWARILLVYATWFGPPPLSEAERARLPDERYVPEMRDPSSPIHRARVIHRTIRDCVDDAVVEPERKIQILLPDGNRYRNFACRSRKLEQCLGDGSRDRYYDERCEDEKGRAIELPNSPKRS